MLAERQSRSVILSCHTAMLEHILKWFLPFSLELPVVSGTQKCFEANELNYRRSVVVAIPGAKYIRIRASLCICLALADQFLNSSEICEHLPAKKNTSAKFFKRFVIDLI